MNEAQGLSKDATRQLLTMFDDLRPWVTWIFTTMVEGQERIAGMEDGSALIDRMTRLHLEVDTTAFARHAKAIAEREGLDGQPLTAYEALVLRCKGSLRAALQAIEGGAMTAPEKPADDGWREIRSRFGNTCRECRGTVKAGDLIGYHQREGVYCPACWAKESKR